MNNKNQNTTIGNVKLIKHPEQLQVTKGFYVIGLKVSRITY